MTDLPVNIDTTYADDGGDASVQIHQSHHDTLHGLFNAIDGATPDPSSLGLAPAAGTYAVNTVATSGATETLTLAPAHRVTMDQSCTFTFPTPTAGHTFLLWLSGAFTPTFPASVDWDTATAPTYATPSLYGFTSLDAGTTWAGSLIASGLG